MKFIFTFIFDNTNKLIYICFMKKAIISEAKQKRSDRYASIKKEFESLMKFGSDKTAVIKLMAKNNKISTATIYKAIK